MDGGEWELAGLVRARGRREPVAAVAVRFRCGARGCAVVEVVRLPDGAAAAVGPGPDGLLAAVLAAAGVSPLPARPAPARGTRPRR